MLTRPSLLLRAEGGIVFGASLLLYGELRASWVLFIVLALAPDLSMLGYLLGLRFGTALYNLVHALILPLLLIALSIFYKQLWAVALWVDLDRPYRRGSPAWVWSQVSDPVQ